MGNWLISKITKVQLHDYGCTLKVMRGEVAKNIQLYGEMHRFIPAVAAELGVRMAELPVNHRPRVFGSSKYGISKTFRVILDLLTVKFFLGYRTRPLHMFGMLGLTSRRCRRTASCETSRGKIPFTCATWRSPSAYYLSYASADRATVSLLWLTRGNPC